MNSLHLKLGALIVWTILAFFAGREWRDRSADVDTAEQATEVQTTRADHAEGTRKTDHVDTQVASQSEQRRVDTAAKQDEQFTIIERKVIEYVQANPDPAGCDLDGDGLRAWREANSGSSVEAGLDHPARTDGAMSRPTAAGRREAVHAAGQSRRSSEAVSRMQSDSPIPGVQPYRGDGRDCQWGEGAAARGVQGARSVSLNGNLNACG